MMPAVALWADAAPRKRRRPYTNAPTTADTPPIPKVRMTMVDHSGTNPFLTTRQAKSRTMRSKSPGFAFEKSHLSATNAFVMEPPDTEAI
jgi:hypothetical protein